MFQSPRSGQICSNKIKDELRLLLLSMRFNPLARDKFVQILFMPYGGMYMLFRRFNPLDRVKFVQM